MYISIKKWEVLISIIIGIISIEKAKYGDYYLHCNTIF